MSRFFRTTRTILGLCYKPTICMASAVSVSLYSLPKVHAATTMNNQKPMVIDTIHPNDKQTPKAMDDMDVILEPYKQLRLEMAEKRKKENTLEEGIKMIPKIIFQGFKSEDMLQLMKQTNNAVDSVLRKGDLEKAVGKENLSTFLSLCTRHEGLITAGYDTTNLLLIECRYQKSNIKDLVAMMQEIEVKSSLEENDAARFDDCISDLSSFVQQKTLLDFWEDCVCFQNEIIAFSQQIDKIKDKEKKNALLTALFWMGSIVAFAGAGVKYANKKTDIVQITAQSAVNTIAPNTSVSKDAVDWFANGMIACGGTTAAVTYWQIDTNLSIEVFQAVKEMSNTLSEMINDCKILRKERGVKTQSDAINFFCNYIKTHGEGRKIRDGLQDVMDCIEKYEIDGIKMMNGIEELRKRKLES